MESSWIGISPDGETRCCGAFPETRLAQVRPTRRLAMSCPHSPARRLYLVFFSRVLSFLSRFHLAFVLYVNSDHAWRPTPRFLDMATPPGRFKSSVRVINVDPIPSIHRSFRILMFPIVRLIWRVVSPSHSTVSKNLEKSRHYMDNIPNDLINYLFMAICVKRYIYWDVCFLMFGDRLVLLVDVGC